MNEKIIDIGTFYSGAVVAEMRAEWTATQNRKSRRAERARREALRTQRIAGGTLLILAGIAFLLEFYPVAMFTGLFGAFCLPNWD